MVIVTLATIVRMEMLAFSGVGLGGLLRAFLLLVSVGIHGLFGINLSTVHICGNVDHAHDVLIFTGLSK